MSSGRNLTHRPPSSEYWYLGRPSVRQNPDQYEQHQQQQKIQKQYDQKLAAIGNRRAMIREKIETSRRLQIIGSLIWIVLTICGCIVAGWTIWIQIQRVT